MSAFLGFLGPDPDTATAPPSWLVGLAVGVTLVELITGAAVAIRRWFRRRAARRRVVRVVRVAAPKPSSGPGRVGKHTVPRRAGRRLEPVVVVPLLAGAVVAWLVPGLFGLPAGAATVLLLRRRLRPSHPSAAQLRAREEGLLLAQLPLTADLLAACLGSAASPAQAAEAVARTVGEPMESRLAAASAELALGGSPTACWERFGQDSSLLGALARCLARTTRSGSPPAVPLQGLAAAQRAAAQRAAHARVKRAGVLATMPLGLCFLPAFVLIGIVPVAAGLVSSLASHL
jgi:Flp pilus assembly protein TadB